MLWLVCFSDPRIFPVQEFVTLPSGGVIKSSVVLSCNIVHPDYIHLPFWITPQGEKVDTDSTNTHYVFSYGRVVIDGVGTESTTLEINSLSHSHSGDYRCVIESFNATVPGKTVHSEATVQLRLLGMK